MTLRKDDRVEYVGSVLPKGWTGTVRDPLMRNGWVLVDFDNGNHGNKCAAVNLRKVA